MFRSEEWHSADWTERTLYAMRERRFSERVALLSELTPQTIFHMDMRELTTRIEGCWQDIPRKPMRAQQVTAAQEVILGTIERQADCLSQEEHALIERMLILGGSARITDLQELDAAEALSLRLWADVGMLEGVPTVRLFDDVTQPLARAFARPEHTKLRMRLFSFQATLCAALYLAGVIDDRTPQMLFTQQVLCSDESDEEALQLARRFLWASFDCVDYEDGVLLVHSAVSEPHKLARGRRPQIEKFTAHELLGGMQGILPQEEPLEEALVSAIDGALRKGMDAQECAQSLRLLSKQGAPIEALREVLSSMLMVYCTPIMQTALEDMHYGVVRWDAMQEEESYGKVLLFQ